MAPQRAAVGLRRASTAAYADAAAQDPRQRRPQGPPQARPQGSPPPQAAAPQADGAHGRPPPEPGGGSGGASDHGAGPPESQWCEPAGRPGTAPGAAEYGEEFLALERKMQEQNKMFWESAKRKDQDLHVAKGELARLAQELRDAQSLCVELGGADQQHRDTLQERRSAPYGRPMGCYSNPTDERYVRNRPELLFQINRLESV